MKTNVILMVTFLFFSATSLINAQGPLAEEFGGEEFIAENMPHERFMGADHQNFFTDEQKETIKSIRLESAKEAKPFKDQLRELNAHHQTLVTAEKADMNAIYASIEKTSQVKTELEKIRAKTNQEIRSLLTDEQRIVFDNMKGRAIHQRFNDNKANELRERPKGPQKGFAR